MNLILEILREVGEFVIDIATYPSRRRKQNRCFHHDTCKCHPCESWITLGVIIDWRKIYRCLKCGKVWII